MPDPRPIPVLPCPGGMNNVLPEAHDVFQPQRTAAGMAPPVALRSVVDMDLYSDGALVCRPGAAVQSAMTAPRGLWRVAGRTLHQDVDTLYEGATALVSGLSRRASVCEHWGAVFVTDGERCHEVIGATARTWGLPVPSLTLAPGAGTLEPGRYLVQASFVDAAGNEGGTCPVSAATLTSATGIEIAVGGARPGVAGVALYVSGRDQEATNFLEQIPLGGFPRVLSAVSGANVADPPKTVGMAGPPVGLEGLCSYRAFLLGWRGNVVFRSEAAEPHLFHGDSVLQFPSQIRAMAGLSGGFWVGTEQGLWWVQGDDPGTWIPARRSTAAVAWDSCVTDGSRLPKIQVSGPVALFATARGLALGTADGQILELSAGRYHFALTAASRASMGYAERDGLQQLVVAIVE